MASIKEFRPSRILAILMLSAGFQMPEISSCVEKYGPSLFVYYIYTLKLVPILVLIAFWKSLKNGMKNCHEFFIFVVFSLLYASYEFVGSHSYMGVLKNFPSFIWVFSSLLSVMSASTCVTDCRVWYRVVKYVLVVLGAAIYIADLLANGWNSITKINLYLLLGLLIFGFNKKIQFFVLGLFVISAFFSDARTLVMIGAIIVFLLTVNSKQFLMGRSWLMLFYFSVLATIICIYYESDVFWLMSKLTGRAEIWGYWLGIPDIDSALFGFGTRSILFEHYSDLANYSHNLVVFNQPHSSLIATFIRGGATLWLISTAFICYLLYKKKFSNEKSIVFFSLVFMLSLNGLNDYFYPGFPGLLLLFTYLSPETDGQKT